MALETLPSNKATWGYWPYQQHVSTECGVVEASNMVPNDCWSGTVAPISRVELANSSFQGPSCRHHRCTLQSLRNTKCPSLM
jgi:hypothetical protein